MPLHLSTSHRIAAIASCQAKNDKNHLTGMRVGLADISKYKDGQEKATAADVTWLTGIGTNADSDCDLYLIPKNQGITDFRATYDKEE